MLPFERELGRRTAGILGRCYFLPSGPSPLIPLLEGGREPLTHLEGGEI